MLLQTEKLSDSLLKSSLNEIDKNDLILLNEISFNWIKLKESTLIQSQPDIHNYSIYCYPQSSQIKFYRQLDH